MQIIFWLIYDRLFKLHQLKKFDLVERMEKELVCSYLIDNLNFFKFVLIEFMRKLKD